MADSRETSSSSVQAGGAATSAGIIFQQQVGALFGACLLSEERVDERLNLGAAVPVWLRFETEAPVDDILVCTSNDGYIAVQAKTKVSLSRDLTSPFGKTVSQFVRHWIACRDGDRSHGWNRPLDPARDRLVLAVNADAPATVRVDLPAALQRRAQPGNASFTVAEQRALDAFDSCVDQAWKSVTSEEPAPELLDQLAGLVTVFVFNPSGADRTLTQKILAASLPDRAEAATALNALETVCGQMMAQRGGADLASLRQKLMTEGVNLAAAPRYQQDIAALGKHAQSVADSLRRHEAIEVVNGERVSIVRECQEVVEAAAREGSLLIIGEPGAGKSGVLNALAHHLLEQGKDVLELAVDQHSVESLEGLSKDLKLEHGLLEVLEDWDGTGPAWLIIDALDATRGGTGEGVFRTLITQVLERCQRWRVVASIRTFDLRMGQQFRSLFKGSPPSPDLAESEFSNVRHISIPRWSGSELQQLLDQAPTLSAAFASAPPRLWELATVPFNTRLLGELIANDVSMVKLNRVSSQAELLVLYWERRIERHGTPAQLCLRGIVEAMVDTRVLRVQKHAVASNAPTMIDTLSHEGVLIIAENGRWVQFRHHILFDFAAARILLDPDDIINGKQHFPKVEARGLMLAPALAFVLQETWDLEPDRASFWTAVGHILADEDGDPIIQSAVGRVSAEYPIEAVDTRSLAGRIAAGDGKASGALSYLSGALAIRLEDDPDTPTEPWIRLLAASASNIALVAYPVRFLLFQFIERTQDAALRSELGLAARALLEHGYGLEEPGILVSAAIGFVADTYETDPEASRRLLSRVFDEDRFLKFGWEEVPAVSRKIESIAIADPAFGVEIYRRTYEYDVTEDRETPMGSSQILSLRSNTRQDYDMARYELGEFMPVFLDRHPQHAIEAVVAAVEGYVAREHPIREEWSEHNLTIAEKNVLREDRSHIWAHDPEGAYSRDAEVLIVKLLERLRSSGEEDAIHLANLLIDKASLAVFWSRLFMAAVERNDALINLLLPFAMTEQFLVMPDTCKDAIDVVATGYEHLAPEKRETFERQALTFDFSGFTYDEEAKSNFLRSLFSTIGRDALATDDARAFTTDIGQETVRNERPVISSSSIGPPEPYFWIRDLDPNHPANADLMEAINSAKKALALESDAQAPSGLTLDDAYRVLGRVEQSLRGDGVNPQLKIYGEGIIGQACVRIVERKILPSGTDALATETFLRFLDIAAGSASPEVQDETERAFEQNQSWGSPAARVEAAQAVLDLVLQRPDLLPRVADRIDTLLADPHPAVRLQAGSYLIRIWDLDRDGFWQRLEARLAEETNLGVLESLINRVLGRILHAEPARVESLILDLLKRFPCDNERQARLRKAVADQLVILWVTYERQAARTVVDAWIAAPAPYHDELTGILSTMRGAFVAGLGGQKKLGDDALRHRALAWAAAVVEAASEGLARYSSNSRNDGDRDDARKFAQLLDAACHELYFSTPARSHGRASDHRPPSVIELGTFFDEAAPILQRIGDCATPSTVYYLLQLLEFLLPFDPERAFDLAAHVLRNGGKDTGFQFESLGADLIVRLVGVFLADHREIFENEERRVALIECLEIFMKAGWPAAQRLLYRLPDLIQ